MPPAVPGLTAFVAPEAGRGYVIGADPAEGNPQSDESAASVVDGLTGEQVAVLAGRFDPAVFAAHVATASEYYNSAPVLVERNNHGHAVLLWLGEFSTVHCLPGLDGKPGWLESGRSKPLAVDCAADVLRDGAQSGAPAWVRDRETLDQLASIEGSTLRAPEGALGARQHDDRALAHILALAAIRWGLAGTGVSFVGLPPADPTNDFGGW